MSIWDTGYGSPEFLDGGYGSPGLEDSGYGSPFAFDFEATTITLPADGTLYGNEGGYLVKVTASGPVFLPSKGYRVDVVDSDGQLYPQTRPGCHGGIEGLGTSINAEANGYTLSFALPPLPVLETFDVRITRGDGFVMTLLAAVKTTYQPMSLEVDAIRARLPNRVFSKKGAPPDIHEVP